MQFQRPGGLLTDFQVRVLYLFTLLGCHPCRRATRYLETSRAPLREVKGIRRPLAAYNVVGAISTKTVDARS